MSDNANETPSVAEFLEAQARHLWAKTGGKITGLVTISSSIHGKCYSLYVVAPSVEKYDMLLRVLSFIDHNGIEQFLLECGNDSSAVKVAEELLVFGNQIPPGTFQARLTLEEVQDEIGCCLRNKNTRSVMESLIAHVNESEQRK
jgi:hypothetical protein